MLKLYIPSKILQPYVAFYLILKLRKKDYQEAINEFCLPSGHGHMGFHLKGRLYVEQKNKKQELSRFYTVGQRTQSYQIKSRSEFVDLFIVSFNPTGLWHFFGVDSVLIKDEPVETNSIVNNTMQVLHEYLKSSQANNKRITYIEKFLLEVFFSVQPQLNIIDSAVKMIYKSYGSCCIKDVITKLGISERYFQKRFKKMVGIAPTTYARIVRFNYMFAQIEITRTIDCKALSAIYNYYDLSHFSNDFKKYCGVAPSQFNLGKFNFFQKLIRSKSLITKR